MDVLRLMTVLQAIAVNITAERRTEGCAPANKLKAHKPEIINTKRSHTVLFRVKDLVKKRSSH